MSDWDHSKTRSSEHLILLPLQRKSVLQRKTDRQGFLPMAVIDVPVC
jgi:hypothetical protein